MKTLKLKTYAILLSLFVIGQQQLYSQGTAINTSGNSADQSAMLDVDSPDKGVLIPRLSEQNKNSIVSPATGLIIYQTDGNSGLWYYDGNAWQPVTTPTTGGDNLGNHNADMNLNMSNFNIDSLASPANSLSAVNAISVQNSSLTYSDATGSNNAYEITLTPNVTSYTKGMAVTFKANFDNTAIATLNINGLGNKAIKKNGFNDIEPYDILEGQMISVVYDGNNFQMINTPGKYVPLLVFVSSNAYDPNTSVSSRDAACQSDATSAGLSGTFKAWISNGGSNNITSTQFRSYYRTDGKLVANSWTDLTDGTLENPINITASGSAYDGSVWTGLNADGSVAANNCSGWTSISNTSQGQIGNSSSTTSTWTNSNTAYNCGNANPGVVGYADYNTQAYCQNCFPGSTKGNSYTNFTSTTKVKRNMNINGQPKPCSDEWITCNGGCYECNGIVYTTNPYRHYCVQQP